MYYYGDELIARMISRSNKSIFEWRQLFIRIDGDDQHIHVCGAFL